MSANTAYAVRVASMCALSACFAVYDWPLGVAATPFLLLFSL